MPAQGHKITTADLAPVPQTGMSPEEDPTYVRLVQQQEEMRDEFKGIELMREQVVREKNILLEQKAEIEKIRTDADQKLNRIEERLALLRTEEERAAGSKMRTLARMYEKMDAEAALKLVLKLDDQTMIDIFRAIRQSKATEILELMTQDNENLTKAAMVTEALANPAKPSTEFSE